MRKIVGTISQDFSVALKIEFKEDDAEQMRNTKTFLQSMVQRMRVENDPSVVSYCSFIFGFVPVCSSPGLADW